MENLQNRWTEINKPDAENVILRGRFVAKRLNTGKESALFTAIPPLEASRALASMASMGRGDKSVIMVNDVA